MQDKVLVISIYVCTGLLIALLPIFLVRWPARPGSAASPGFWDRGYWPWVMALVGLIVSMTMPWWLRQDGIVVASAAQILSFLAIATGGAFFLRYKPLPAAQSWQKPYRPGPEGLWVFALYVFLSAWMSFSTGLIEEPNAMLTAWHHWGAYVGPSEVLKTGAALFRDFPAQYGLGPTALIAAVCGDDCWTGMYWIVAFTTFAYAFLTGFMAWVLARDQRLPSLIILAIAFAVCFLWTSYPPGLGSPTMTPSVSGLRFLPMVLLLTLLFAYPGIENSRRTTAFAFILWFVGFVWSPESAFYVTFLWWPYYLLSSLVSGVGRSHLRNLVQAFGILAVSLGLLVMASAFCYWLAYRTMPSGYGVLAYAINPPGPMPVDPRGTVWLFLISLFLGLGSLFVEWRRSGASLAFRRSFVVVLACYGAFSYFLGRSHDNNLLNILPFVFLMLLNTLVILRSSPFSRMAAIMLAAMLAWLPSFGWAGWQSSFKEFEAFRFRPANLLASFSFANPETSVKVLQRFAKGGLVAGVPEDAGRAIKAIRQQYTESSTVIDYSADLQRASSNEVWSAIHGPANFPYIPSPRRREFLALTAAKLRRNGWLIVDKKYPADEWLSDFDAVYKRADRLDFGSYYAIRYLFQERSR